MRLPLRTLLSLLLVLALTAPVLAVQRGQKRHTSTPKPKPAAASEAAPREEADAEGLTPDYRFGEFTVPVDVTKLQTTIPIGLAPHAHALIEFPANDPIYGKHPGDENFVTIDDKESKADDVIVLRPGDGFVVPRSVPVKRGKRTVLVPERPKPATNISFQMTSGLIFTLVIYPVPTLSRNANRVVITYDREKVIEARRRAGLRADLVPPDKMVAQLGYDPTGRANAAAPAPAPSPQATPLPTVSRSASPTVVPVTVRQTEPPRALPASNFVPTAQPSPAQYERPAPQPAAPAVQTSTPDDAALDERAATPSTSAPDLERIARDEMSRVMNSSKQLRFGKPVHGLALAVSRSRFVMAGYRIEVVAVRNDLREPIRLVPGQPEIYVERMNEGPIDSERLTLKASVSTLAAGAVLLPGSTYFFAFAFDEPILSAREELRVAVAQTNAADVPVSASLITAAR